MTINVPPLVKFVHGVQVFYSYKRIEERVDYNCCMINTWRFIVTCLPTGMQVAMK